MFIFLQESGQNKENAAISTESRLFRSLPLEPKCTPVVKKKQKFCTKLGQELGTEEQANLEEKLITGFIVNGINPNVLEERSFVDFLATLRPTFNIPSPDAVEAIFEKFYSELVVHPRKLPLNGIIYVHATVLEGATYFLGYAGKTDTESYVFIKFVELFLTETSDIDAEIFSFLKIAVAEGETKFACKFHTVVHNLRNFDFAGFKKLSFVETHESYLETIKTKLIEDNFIEHVRKILRYVEEAPLNIKQGIIEATGIAQFEYFEEDYTSFYTSLNVYITIIDRIVQSVNNKEIIVNASDYEDLFLKDKTKKYFDFCVGLNEVEDGIRRQISAAEGLQKWFDFHKRTNIDELEKMLANVISNFQPVEIACNMLHYEFKGEYFRNDPNITEKLINFCAKELSEEEFRILNKYRDNERSFEHLKEKQLGPKAFWDIVAAGVPKLRAFANKILDIRMGMPLIPTLPQIYMGQQTKADVFWALSFKTNKI